ncbi:inositol monophosphatase family protein [Campylobacter geochelonis]|uniref:inositol monophosphatase family protein n=1 Tax=Campylobacter geochelonis TaxID=1780362 RepID=UPI000770B267|nr:inositol monophosphatase family protein [Campylobacter geochelonis]CZE46552.1 3'(2')%2C5'-bisphosphate nucleotidase [Campylobacter geochelonis]
MDENLEEILRNLDSFLDEVGKFQLDSRKSGFSVNTKSSDVDFVTQIDKKSDEMIINFIRQNYPTHEILTEEHGSLPALKCKKSKEQKISKSGSQNFKESEFCNNIPRGDNLETTQHKNGKNETNNKWCWVVDPIDGTTNFIHSYPLHCISVGLKFNEETVLGMVVLPVLKMKFYAIKGAGAFLNGEKINVSKTSELKKAIISTGFPYNRAVENPNLVYFNKIINQISGIRRSGSAAIDLCFNAAGFCDAYFEFNINEWDFCAGWLILNEAGGRGKVRKFGHNTMYIFTNSHIDEALEKALFG